jgi:hypothetical protein
MLTGGHRCGTRASAASRAVAARRSEILYSCVELSRVVCGQVSAGLCTVIQRNHEVGRLPSSSATRRGGVEVKAGGPDRVAGGAFADRAEVHRNAKPVRGGLVVGGDRRAGGQQPTEPKPAGDRAQQRSVRRRRDVAERVTGRLRIDRPGRSASSVISAPGPKRPLGRLALPAAAVSGTGRHRAPGAGPKAVGSLLDLAM